MRQAKKNCRSCGERKELTLFSPLKTGPKGRHSSCKQCRRQQNIDRYHEKRDIQRLTNLPLNGKVKS